MVGVRSILMLAVRVLIEISSCTNRSAEREVIF
jgi:hypothetical protein